MFLNKNVYSEDSVTGLFDVGDSGWTFLMWDVRLLYFIDVGDSAAGLFSSWTNEQASRDKGVAWSGGCHAPLPQKTLKKKVNLTELSQDAKKNFFDLFFIMLMV